jgi:hypothetical protein
MQRPAIDWAGRRELPTPAEDLFAVSLDRLVPGLDYWLHLDADGKLWMLVSLDFVRDHATRDTLRMDFDAAGVKGGWSPAYLNWDAEVRANEAGIDNTGPEGIEISLTQATSMELPALAAAWFERHRNSWADSERATRWHHGPRH